MILVMHVTTGHVNMSQAGNHHGLPQHVIQHVNGTTSHAEVEANLQIYLATLVAANKVLNH